MQTFFLAKLSSFPWSHSLYNAYTAITF